MIGVHRLIHRIHIMERVESQDTDGALDETWQTLYLDTDTPLDSVPAEVLTGPGKEMVAADAKQSQVDARINIHYLPGITLTQWQQLRLIWDGITYDITGVSTDRTGREEIRLLCTAGMNDGN